MVEKFRNRHALRAAEDDQRAKATILTDFLLPWQEEMITSLGRKLLPQALKPAVERYLKFYTQIDVIRFCFRRRS